MDFTKINSKLEHGDHKRIAEAAGVAVATVSRVLNGKKVSSAYTVKVVAAAISLLAERELALQEAQKSVDNALKSAA